MGMSSLLNFRSILFFLIFISCSYGQAQTQKKNQYTWSSLSKALWDVKKKEHISNTVDVHFDCSDSNKINISLLRLPQNSSRSPVIIRIQTGYIPPSRKGHKQFIYTSEWSADRKKLLIHQTNQNMVLDLFQLHQQVFKNQEMGKQEYQEKIKHCQTLEDPQNCISSSSGYQPGEPSIILEVDFGEKFEKSYFIFDPEQLQHLKQLRCYSNT